MPAVVDRDFFTSVGSGLVPGCPQKDSCTFLCAVCGIEWWLMSQDMSLTGLVVPKGSSVTLIHQNWARSLLYTDYQCCAKNTSKRDKPVSISCCVGGAQKNSLPGSLHSVLHTAAGRNPASRWGTAESSAESLQNENIFSENSNSSPDAAVFCSSSWHLALSFAADFNGGCVKGGAAQC